MENKIYPTIKNSVLLCLLLVGIQIGLGILIYIFRLMFNLTDSLPIVGILNILNSVISFGIVLLIGFKKSKRNFNAVFKFNMVSPFLWVAITALSIGLNILLSEFDNLFNCFLPMPEMFRNMFESLMGEQLFIISIILIGVIPGFVEELLFRGIILGGLKNNYSNRKAIIVSALLFGIIHLNPWQFITAFILGLIYALICIETNSILLCIYMHFFNNIMSTIGVRLKDIIPIRGYNLVNHISVVFQPLWFNLSGLVFLVLGIFLLKIGFGKAKTSA
jgi:membrane protease YdiL (CAAX protease family)